MKNPLESPDKLLFIDGLRALAAIYVVMHHAKLHYILDTTKLSPIQKLTLSGLSFGHYAVGLFIVISGYSLMLPAIKRGYVVPNVSDFYWRRVKRILPPYYISLLLSLLLIYFFIGTQKTLTHWHMSIPVTFNTVLAHLFLIHDLFLSHVYKINHSLWSISVECRIYLFFPLIVFFWKRLGPVVTLVVTILFSAFLYIILTHFSNRYEDINLASGVNPYIVLFVLGMFAADMSFSDSRLSRFIDRLHLGTVMIFLIAVFVLFKKMLFTLNVQLDLDDETAIADLIFGAVCFCLLVICGRPKYEKSFLRFFKQIFSWQPLVFLGMFAYSVYLVHAPILELISVYLIPLFNISSAYYATLVLIILGTSIVVGLAYLFFLAFEKPFLNKRKESLKKTELNAVLNPAP
ncbi:acyltransferase [Pedobacter frigiditerrae]|uniref:acyltransferase family protein n=1 Tax=Pedobacter frigiditerrae TaxID=2530452 RepID=UPI0029319273|nr:acyltransferase [Pedobacter frigiditerrae]